MYPVDVKKTKPRKCFEIHMALVDGKDCCKITIKMTVTVTDSSKWTYFLNLSHHDNCSIIYPNYYLSFQTNFFYSIKAWLHKVSEDHVGDNQNFSLSSPVSYVYKPTRCTKFLWLDFIFNTRSTCFGLYQSVFRSNLFICCTSYPHIPNTTYSI